MWRSPPGFTTPPSCQAWQAPNWTDRCSLNLASNSTPHKGSSNNVSVNSWRPGAQPPPAIIEEESHAEQGELVPRPQSMLGSGLGALPAEREALGREQRRARRHGSVRATGCRWCQLGRVLSTQGNAVFFLPQREVGSKFFHLPSRGLEYISPAEWFCPQPGSWPGVGSGAKGRHREASLVKMMPKTVQMGSSEAISIPQTAVVCQPGYAGYTTVCSDAQVWVVCVKNKQEQVIPPPISSIYKGPESG